jgi:hypothetical protein
MTDSSEKDRPEFDRYAHSYDELLEDPIRNLFAHYPLHFHRRKWLLIERLLKRSGVTLRTQRWLELVAAGVSCWNWPVHTVRGLSSLEGEP